MSKSTMRGHFRYLRFKTFPMTPRTPQCEVFRSSKSSSEFSGVSEDSNPNFFQVLGFTPTLGQSRVATLPHIASPLFVIPRKTSLIPSFAHNEWPLTRTLHATKGTLKGTQVLVGHVHHYCHLGPTQSEHYHLANSHVYTISWVVAPTNTTWNLQVILLVDSVC
jgi:hypothetical protein